MTRMAELEGQRVLLQWPLRSLSGNWERCASGSEGAEPKARRVVCMLNTVLHNLQYHTSHVKGMGRSQSEEGTSQK